MADEKIFTPSTVRDRPVLILASASPRRRQLLAQAGLDFEIVESGVDERREPAEPGPDFALRMACEKALAVSARRTEALVLGADTVVEIRAKPSASHATPMTLGGCC